MRPKPTRTSLCVPIAGFIATLWVIEIVNFLMGHRLCAYGIVPRTANGLIGIPLAPILHGSMGHLFMNTAPLLILGGLMGIHGRMVFWEAKAVIVLAGGLGLWVIGRPACHVGASGLIFGYFGFLVSRILSLPSRAASRVRRYSSTLIPESNFLVAIFFDFKKSIGPFMILSKNLDN